MTKDSSSERLTIKDYVEAAYLHGLCVENLDTGELAPPRDISEVQWIIDKLEALIQSDRQELLKRIEGELPEKDNRKHAIKGVDEGIQIGRNQTIDSVKAIINAIRESI